MNITLCGKICSYSGVTDAHKGSWASFSLDFPFQNMYDYILLYSFLAGKAVALSWVRKEQLLVCYVILSACFC